MTSLEKILKFTDLINQLQRVERAIYIKGKNRLENDLEHQYQLALLAWYIIDSEKLKLDLAKAIKYALVHDFVEVYAGDTYFYGNHKGKAVRERRAAARIKKEFPEFKELHDIIEAYESKRDRESCFVYALDKIIPLYNVYLDNGRYWKKADIPLKILFDKKKNKVAKSPELGKHFDEMIALLHKEEGRLFRKRS